MDTSALFAGLAENDEDHPAAASTFRRLAGAEPLVTHNYVVVEVSALVQRRLGGSALRALHDDLLPAIELMFVDRDVHMAAVSALLAAIRRRVSFVDWVSFEVMRRRGIETAFAFDRDFSAQGFTTVP